MSPLFPFQFRPRASTARIILHSSHTTPDVPNVEAWLRVKAREMGLLEIGYHYVIERDGFVADCRQPACVGAHTPNFNKDSIGICFAGGMEAHIFRWDGHPAQVEEVQSDNFPPEQIRAGLRLVDHLLETFGPLEVVGHTELQRYRKRNLACPGFDMDVFRQRLSNPIVPHGAPKDTRHAHDTQAA